MFGLFILLAACLLRGFSASPESLMGTALLGGASIGTIQALMPALIKKEYTQTASTVMSLSARALWPVRQSPPPAPSRCFHGSR
jgi:CP family cyanate transporter-like MFS transporter